jgi:putative nucleotidyltransferase-like protein
VSAVAEADASTRNGVNRPRVRGMSAETQFLMLMAPGKANKDIVRAAATGPLDWDRVLRLARAEHAVALIYPMLRSVAPDVVPAGVLEQMRQLALVSDFALLQLESRLRASLAVLSRARLRVMLLKGAALAYSVYGDIRMRPMSDVDILVDPSDAEAARREMLNVGWCEIPGSAPDRVYEHHHHAPPLRDAHVRDVQFEIHTALFPKRQPFAFDLADLWSRGRPLDPRVGVAFVPHVVHSLLHACLHFLWSHQAQFGAWRTVRDVDAIARRADLDWDEFVAVARRARGETACYWTLRIAEIAGGVKIPASVLRDLRPRRNGHLLRAVEQHFLSNVVPDGLSCPSAALGRAIWALGVMPRRSGHGDIRPWDMDADFVPSAVSRRADSSRSRRVRRILASPGYVGRLLRGDR